jgi:hypothetical protein
MKRLTHVCLILTFCASSLVAAPPPQSNRRTSGESKCSAGFKACQESLSEFKEARKFMHLKATVLADLDRLEKPRPMKPMVATVRHGDANRQKTGNDAVISTTVVQNRKSSAQATSAVQPVSLESTAGAPVYRHTP